MNISLQTSAPQEIAINPHESLSQKLEERLWVIARRTASEFGMEFTVPASANMRDFIGAGVKNMRRMGRVGDADLEEAEHHLTQLIEEMIRASKALAKKDAGRPKPVLREGALVIAKRLCPLWPFS